MLRLQKGGFDARRSEPALWPPYSPLACCRWVGWAPEAEGQAGPEEEGWEPGSTDSTAIFPQALRV